MTSLATSDAASELSDDVSTLEREIEEIAARRASVKALADELIKAEDPAQGIFHHERIFTLKQDYLRLEVEIEFRRKKINRIKMGEREG